MFKLFHSLVFVTVFTSYAAGQSKSNSEYMKLVEEQLIAYNNRDIEAFLKPYKDSVKVYRYPRVLQY